MKIALLLAFVCGFLFNVQAQQTPSEREVKNRDFIPSDVMLFEKTPFLATLSGKVTDQNNTPIAGAAVVVLELGSGTTTTNTGFYSFMVPIGSYRVQFSYPGCESVLVLADPTVDTTYKLDIQLDCEARKLQSTIQNAKYSVIKNKMISIPLTIESNLNQAERGSYDIEQYKKLKQFLQ